MPCCFADGVAVVKPQSLGSNCGLHPWGCNSEKAPLGDPRGAKAGTLSGLSSTGRGEGGAHGQEMSDRDSTGGGGKGTAATAQGRLHALHRLRADGGRRQGPMELFWHNKYSVGHHEYSIRQRSAERPLRELGLTGGLISSKNRPTLRGHMPQRSTGWVRRWRPRA